MAAPMPTHPAPPPAGQGGAPYRKPGTVLTAQVLMWVQFSLVLAWVAIVALTALALLGLLSGLGAELEDVAWIIVTVAAVIAALVVALTVLLGVLAAKLGKGRHWAQVTTIVLMILFILVSASGLLSQTQRSDATIEIAFHSDLYTVVAGLAIPAVTLVCLFTGSANQWFRQGGPVAARPVSTQEQPPRPPAPYSPY
jgi:hypothetical protein